MIGRTRAGNDARLSPISAHGAAVAKVVRVLVTGASGFLGRFVPGLLIDRSHEVHLAGRHLDQVEWPAPLPPQAIRHHVDLLSQNDATALIAKVRPTHLLHLAWYAEPGKVWHSPLNLDWVAASLHLFRAFAEGGGKRFVGAGSCAEYDWSGGTLSAETTPLAPSTPYGAAKARLFQDLTACARASGVSFAWGRVFFSFGPFEHPDRLMPQVVRGLLRGEQVALSEGLQVRDFIYSEDAARMFSDLVDADIDGPVNIASGNGLSIRDFTKLVLQHAGREDLLNFGARPEGNDTAPYIVADISTAPPGIAEAAIGTVPGVARTVAWWKQRL